MFTWENAECSTSSTETEKDAGGMLESKEKETEEYQSFGRPFELEGSHDDNEDDVRLWSPWRHGGVEHCLRSPRSKSKSKSNGSESKSKKLRKQIIQTKQIQYA